MEQPEKLRALLPHWIGHNLGHAGREWEMVNLGPSSG
jgi:hypothetical protein